MVVEMSLGRHWPRLPMVVVRSRERQKCTDPGILRRYHAGMNWV